ncbi:DEAD/DEAH box helicase [Halosquirtibacter xylanolyticus]|uniref:DEAD/DEAH box helicase n=1 Tax=Halosquirtibacter xylanolyticus TaxID=3374599 RepID=UPI00374A8293|nr:DEAD/DEAH box helicase [Prolixibacteraceae bacterium]
MNQNNNKSKNNKSNGRSFTKNKSNSPRSNRNPRSRGNKKAATSDIKPEQLIKKATSVEQVKYVSEIHYADLDLHPKLAKNIERKNYQQPTEIQEKSIDHLMESKNLIGIAATGTGKTGAFLIPMVHQMLNDNSITALIMVPTRELAQQVDAEFKSLTLGTSLNSVCFIGGTNINKDIANTKRKMSLIVGTPGRLNDLIQRKNLKLGRVSKLVIDEFDRMLDMGFIHDVRKIIAAMKSREQTMLFSATTDKSQEALIKEIIKNPVRVNATNHNISGNNVDQDIIKVGSDESKFDLLLKLVKDDSYEKIILFAETKHQVNKISKKLNKSGVKSDVIHGNKSQNYRTNVIEAFKQGKLKVMVATDVAARGIDIKDVSLVINFQIPPTMDSYTHRIGRTGRAGSTGKAITFIN